MISINASSGEVFVNINNGWELDELHNVLITSPTSGNTLIYDASVGVWKNANITGGTGLSVTNGAGTIALANTGVTSAVAGTGISVSSATGAVTVTNTAPDQTVSLTQGGATTITGTYPNFTISSVNTTYSPATSTVAGLIELGSDTVQTVASNAVSATASRSYGLQVNASGQGVINVPWTDTVYSLPTATSTVLGGIELGSDTVQTVAPNAVSATASRSYALQLNASGQAVVNVPWTDTNSGGTVTSVSALTLGTTGTDLSSTVATSTTTPVITLNVPTASATNRGALSSADWTTFNNKFSNGNALSATTGSFSGVVTSTVATGTAPLTIASTTLNTNLNADLLDGNHASAFYLATNPSGYTTNTGTVTSITAGTGLSGGTITTSGTVALANTAVTAGSYTNANITVDAQGRLTSASNGTASGGTVTSVSGTGTVSGLTLTGTVTSSGSLTLGGNLSITADMIYDSFTATASQTTFTSSQTYTASKIDVYANGIKMVNGADVTVSGGTSVVFATGVASGTRVDLVYPI